VITIERMELMDTTNKASFEDALESAVQEAVAEDETVEDEGFDFEDEEASDESELSDEEIAEDPAEDEELEAEGDEADEDEAAQSVFEWNGNPDELPDHVEYDGKVYDLTKVYKSMQAGFTKKMQGLSEKQREAEELAKQYAEMVKSQKSQQAEVEDPRPANPTEDMSPDQIEKRWDDIQKWTARQTYRDMVREGTIPDPETVKSQMAQQEQQFAAQRRLNLLTSQPGWNEQVEGEMLQLAESNPFWASQLQTDDGALALYEFVQNKMTAAQLKEQAAKLETEKVKRSAGSHKRATPKSSSQKKSAAKSAADNFADLAFEDKLDVAINDALGL
jgi:hypothetical protein